MEKNSYIDYQSPNLGWGSLPIIRHPNLFPTHMNPFYNKISSNGLFPSGFPEIPLSMAGQPQETNTWFDSLPHSRHALNFVPQKNLPTETFKKVEGHDDLPLGTGCSQKQFFVFDQSGKQTTMLYSCKIGTPVPFMNPGDQNQPCHWRKEDRAINRLSVSHSEPLLVGELHDNQNDGIGRDMHEDTEELNALLYSDDDANDDEETSTGHSPSYMTIDRVEDWLKARREEVDSSASSTKRQKLLNGGYDKPLTVTDAALTDTARSMKCVAFPETEDGTEPSCGNAVNQLPREFSSFSGKKRSRKEDIHETIQILQKVIPDCKGKDTMDTIDEAIHYLQCLKSTAKDIGPVAF